MSGRYRLESKLGSGGMSTVYLGIDETLDRQVAIKVLHREISDEPDQLERFRREARAVARLSHPNVVQVIDAGEDAGHPYIVFEYVPGETLKDRIRRLGTLPVDEAVAYAIEIGRGLAAAHTEQLVHRDVKPQNVLLNMAGRAKVTDFGIARSLESAGLTATGRVLGTTDYVSPEQAMGKDVDGRTDIYSLGIVLYEMLTGDVPFKAETQVAVAMKHVNEALPDIQRRRPGISAALAAVLDQSTSKRPEDRQFSMDAFLDDLETVLEVEVARAGHSTGEATSVLQAIPEKRRLITRTRVSWVSVALLIAVAIAALVLAAGSDDDEPGPSGGEGISASGEVKIASVADFDPPPGDGDENSEAVGNAIDGNPSGTTWATETYTAGLGDKPGVGLVIDAGRPVAAREIAIRSVESGWSAEVYATTAGSAPDDLAGWGAPIGSASDIGTQESIQLDATDENRLYLLWITDLATVDEGFRVEITDISLRG